MWPHEGQCPATGKKCQKCQKLNHSLAFVEDNHSIENINLFQTFEEENKNTHKSIQLRKLKMIRTVQTMNIYIHYHIEKPRRST